VIPGIVWVVASDWLMAQIIPDPDTLTRIATAKGLLFVFVTGLIIYALLARQRAAHDRVQAAYLETERSFRLLFMNNPLPVWAYDRETLLFLEINDVALAKYGYSRAELLRMKVTEIHPTDEVPALLRAIAMRRDVREVSGTWRHRLKDGRIIDAEVQVHDLEFRQRPARVVVALDVTERNRAFRLEQQRAARAAALAETALAMNLAGAVDELLHVATDAARAIFGAGLAETVLTNDGAGPGTTSGVLRAVSAAEAFVPWQDALWIVSSDVMRQQVRLANRAVRLNREQLAALQPEACMSPPSEGSPPVCCWLAAPLVIRDGTNLGMIHLVNNHATDQCDTFTDEDEAILTQLAQMTTGAVERVRLFQEGVERERRFRELVEGLEAIVWEADPATKQFTYVSHQATAILGYSVDAWTASPSALATSLSVEDCQRVRAYLSAVVEGASPIPCEVRARAADGRTVWLRIDGAAHPDDTGRVVHLRGLMTDVTGDRDRAERAARGEKLRALGQLSSGVAHDLNQTLGLITGYGELLQSALDETPSATEHLREMVDVMIRAAADGGETVRRMLQFVQTPRDEAATAVDLTSVIQEVVQLTAPRWRDASQVEGRPIELTVEVEGDVVIAGTAATLREALTNLVLNAVDALPAGGEINLSVRAVDDRAEVVVSDTGIGMSDEVRERIFEPFYTTKGDRGTGLGLPTVFGIVEAHHGDVTVQSEVGRGTAFTLSFPLSRQDTRDEPAAPDTKSPAGDPPAVSLHCLVVDDEPQLARMLGTMLRRLGHQYILAHSGEEALQKLAAAPVDVLVTDVGMGPSMNGWELAERALVQWPALPVVLATGWGASIDPDEARTRGVVAILSKPYRGADIQHALGLVVAHLRESEGQCVEPPPAHAT